MEEPVTVDFETQRIDNRPWYPPRPCGLAIRWPGGKKEYLAVRHRTGENNATDADMRAKLREVYASKKPVLFHNGPFDIDVADVHLGVGTPEYVEDTLFLAFLNNPHEPTIALKPLGEKYLKMPPEERDALQEWILTNVPEAKRKKKEWGAYIDHAPPSVVGPYALDDVERTYRLWRHMRPIIHQRGMDEAYEREVKLIPVTMEMERSGVRVNLRGLKKAKHIFEDMDSKLVKEIHRELGGLNTLGAEFNVDSGPQLGKAMLAAGKLNGIIKTKTGKISTKIDNLHKTCGDKQLLNMLAVHSVLKKYLTSFIDPWINQAIYCGGRVLPGFSQVRARTEYGGSGTRSGRYSSDSPNLQQISANVDESKNKEILQLMQKWLREEYDYDFIGLRDFFLPDEGKIICAVDYNQQELRLLAHFEQGILAKAYNENPRLDVHEYIRQLIYQLTGELYERKAVKILVFGMVYGMGLEKLGKSLESTADIARSIKAGLNKAVPGIAGLIKQLKELERLKKPLQTYGGREYFCEYVRVMEKSRIFGSRDTERIVALTHKMLNYLIQPSAADVTKRGMIQVAERVPEARIAIQVHDELVCMVPDRSYGPKIAHAMCDMEFNVPMLADPAYSDKSWARVVKG